MRYLDQKEKERTRDLWEEAFPEDSASFDDYYYREKLKDNRILAREENGQIVSMAHLNPYRIRVRDREYMLHYIVGVATREDSRHRGHMRAILGKMLRDMCAAGEPFTFLMPAAEAIYRPFGFRFVWDSCPAVWREGPEGSWEEVDLGQALRSDEDSCASIRELAVWQQEFLEKRYEIWAVRDEAYIRRMMLELASENGSWRLLRDRETGRILGMESWWGWGSREQRFLYGEEDAVHRSGTPKPAIMARITCLEEFVRSVSLKKEAPVDQLQVMIRVRDEIIPENDGVFLWILDRTGSRMERQEQEEECPSIGIEEMGEWLLGYRKAEHLPQWAGWIRRLKRIFLDEAV